MKIINNITDKLSDELKEKLEPGSKLSIAAACFSVYAFEELKTQLEGIRDRRPAVYFYIPDLFGRAARKGAAGILYSPPEP